MLCLFLTGGLVESAMLRLQGLKCLPLRLRSDTWHNFYLGTALQPFGEFVAREARR